MFALQIRPDENGVLGGGIAADPSLISSKKVSLNAGKTPGKKRHSKNGGSISLKTPGRVKIFSDTSFKSNGIAGKTPGKTPGRRAFADISNNPAGRSASKKSDILRKSQGTRLSATSTIKKSKIRVRKQNRVPSPERMSTTSVSEVDEDKSIVDELDKCFAHLSKPTIILPRRKAAKSLLLEADLSFEDTARKTVESPGLSFMLSDVQDVTRQEETFDFVDDFSSFSSYDTDILS